MTKKTIINEELLNERGHQNRSRSSRPYSENNENRPRFHEDDYRKNPRRQGPRIVETKLFTSRDKLVEYVNEKGQSDAFIDIYKIEDELYKLVIKR